MSYAWLTSFSKRVSPRRALLPSGQSPTLGEPVWALSFASSGSAPSCARLRATTRRLRAAVHRSGGDAVRRLWAAADTVRGRGVARPDDLALRGRRVRTVRADAAK